MMRQLETYATYVYALYLSWYSRRPGAVVFVEESAHGMALVTVGVPIAGLVLLCAIAVDRATNFGALRAVNLALGLVVVFVMSKWLDRTIRKRQDQVMGLVAAIKAKSPKGPLVAFSKGVGLLLIQAALAFIVMFIVIRT